MEKNATVLVIDDDADIGIMIKIMLKYKGYSVKVFEKCLRGRNNS